MMAAGAIKQRLVGAVVLICAGVVLWSLLFTGPKVRQIDRESQIPPAPEKVRINVADPQPRNVEPVDTDLASKPQFDMPVTDEVAEQAASESAPPKPAPALPAAATEHQDARGLPIAWVVVVGSFADSAKADGIVQQLQQRGHKAFSEKLSRDGRTLYRVSVGPKLEKSQAEKIKPDIDALLKVNAVVRKFENAR
jgi:DedD protein